jgi:hypothetical protein
MSKPGTITQAEWDASVAEEERQIEFRDAMIDFARVCINRHMLAKGRDYYATVPVSKAEELIAKYGDLLGKGD